MTDADIVRDQALQIARGWSGPDAPKSWALTATMFETLADDEALLELAGGIPADRLPALLFVAAVRYVVEQHRDDPFAAYFPFDDTEVQPDLDGEFAAHYRRFCAEHRETLQETWRDRLYQMNEVARTAL